MILDRAALSETVFKGPVEASITDVLDGDTVRVDAHIWPGQSVEVNVRIRGIDAPELHSNCADERKAAEDARSELVNLVGRGFLLIKNIGSAKYYGRVLADVITPDGASIADRMLESGLAQPYDGGKRLPWC